MLPAVRIPWRGPLATHPYRLAQALLVSASIAVSAPAQTKTNTASDPLAYLKKLSIEELLQLDVVSVSRRAQRLTEVPSGIQVLTGEEIRRSGAATLPQALRLAANLQVARIGASDWGITARGFNDTSSTSNKLLVMIDGRTVYSPLFSGTFWNTQDVFLPDLERIEVISGPGGTSWGANAVNGVINIITKSAEHTQGGVLYAGGGGEQRLLGGFRYGGQAGRDTFYRVYAKHLDLDSTARPDGSDARDAWVFSQVGFRVDHTMAHDARLTVQGDGHLGWFERPTADRGDLAGGNLLARYTRSFPNWGELQVQTYVDRSDRDTSGGLNDVLDTYDLDVQHHFSVGERGHLVWGAGYRLWHDRNENSPSAALVPATTTEHLLSAFTQYDHELVPARWRLTIGTKLEKDTYSGSELSPSVRLSWVANEAHMFWAAVSRAVRTPSRVDRDLYVQNVIAGGPNFEAEELWAAELGWRGSAANQQITWSATGYYHEYDRLRSIEPPRPLIFANGVHGDTYGFEGLFTHAPAEWWRWSLGYTFLHKDIRPRPDSRDTNRGQGENADPRHQVILRTSFDLPRRVQLDLDFRHIDAVHVASGSPFTISTIPAYTDLSARIGWMARDDVEISLVGRNLLDPQHPELGQAATLREVERSVHAHVIWRF
jgi:iron complex outermembrane recepter protein